MIHTWKASLLSFWDTRILTIFFFGFSSGLPFLLTLSTLSVWLKESGVSNTIIGFFVLVTLPYTLKFLWGPLIDKISLPFLSSYLGRRRAWALTAQIGLVITLVGLGKTHPEQGVLSTALWALGVAIFSALQDIAVEAYRIESVPEDQRGSAASAMTLGWQFGVMTSGAGGLCFASFFSWELSYKLMAALIGIGIVTTLLSRPTPLFNASASTTTTDMPFRIWLRSIYLDPIKSLFHGFNWRLVLMIILFFKVGDTVLSVMNAPFLIDIGFTKIEIAHTTKVFGISAMIVGGIVGGLCLNQLGVFTCLLLATTFQCISSLLFAAQALIGHNIGFLILVVGIENMSIGFGAAAFIVYLSSFCRTPYTATHFALLSSFGSLVRVFLSIGAGILADRVPWSLFFTLTALGSLPCLLLLVLSLRHGFHKNALSQQR